MLNKNSSALLFLGAAGLVLAYLGNKVYNATNLQLSIAKLGFQLSGLTAKLIIDIKVSNPSDSEFTANALVGSVRMNGNLIGNVAAYPNKKIVGFASTIIPVECNVSLLGAGLEIYQIVTKQKAAAASVNFSGTATINNIPAPLDLTYKIV